MDNSQREDFQMLHSFRSFGHVGDVPVGSTRRSAGCERDKSKASDTWGLKRASDFGCKVRSLLLAMAPPMNGSLGTSSPAAFAVDRLHSPRFGAADPPRLDLPLPMAGQKHQHQS